MSICTELGFNEWNYSTFELERKMFSWKLWSMPLCFQYKRKTCWNATSALYYTQILHYINNALHMLLIRLPSSHTHCRLGLTVMWLNHQPQSPQSLADSLYHLSCSKPKNNTDVVLFNCIHTTLVFFINCCYNTIDLIFGVLFKKWPLLTFLTAVPSKQCKKNVVSAHCEKLHTHTVMQRSADRR